MVLSPFARCPVVTRTSPTFRRRQLARRLRQLREAACLTQGEAARGLEMSKRALSRKETGDAATSVHELKSMLDLYDHYDPELLDLARAAKRKGWWRDCGVEDRAYVDLETEACTVREVSLLCIPGLLQTEEYMRAIFESELAQVDTGRVEKDVAVRKIRQVRLQSSEDSLQFRAVVDEGAPGRSVELP